MKKSLLIPRIFDKTLMWIGINWPITTAIMPCIVLIVLIIYVLWKNY